MFKTGCWIFYSSTLSRFFYLRDGWGWDFLTSWLISWLLGFFRFFSTSWALIDPRSSWCGSWNFFRYILSFRRIFWFEMLDKLHECNAYLSHKRLFPSHFCRFLCCICSKFWLLVDLLHSIEHIRLKTCHYYEIKPIYRKSLKSQDLLQLHLLIERRATSSH